MSEGADALKRVHGSTTFMKACELCNVLSVTRILKFNVDVNHSSNHKNQSTGLMSVSASGHVGLMKKLVSHGADIDAMDSTGQTALFYAAGGHPAAIQWLLDQGADINHLDESQSHALFRAAENGNHEASGLLIALGADTHQINCKNQSAFDAAVDNGKDLSETVSVAEVKPASDNQHIASGKQSNDKHTESDVEPL